MPLKATDRDGFDIKACKSALYRAYKKHVAYVARRKKTISKIGYARKRRKKKKSLTKS